MTKQILTGLIFILFFISCGAPKKISDTTTNRKQPTIADKVIWTAVTYKGTPYKYGGNTKNGIDCSGLINISFKERGIYLPRNSYEISKKGIEIPLNEVSRGDLLFFKTRKWRRKINHVGLVTSVKDGEIKFIHSSISKGVTISSLNNKYWQKVFVIAKRVL